MNYKNPKIDLQKVLQQHYGGMRGRQGGGGAFSPRYVSGGNKWRPTRAANAAQQARSLGMGGGGNASGTAAGAMAASNQANESRFGSILDIYDQMQQSVSGLGKAGAEFRRRKTGELKAQALQTGIKRGYAGSTVLANEESRIDLDAQLAEQTAAEERIKLGLGIMEGKAGVMERRTDKQPDLGLLSSLQAAAYSGPAAAGGGSIKRGGTVGPVWRKPGNQRQAQPQDNMLDVIREAIKNMDNGGVVRDGAQVVAPKPRTTAFTAQNKRNYNEALNQIKVADAKLKHKVRQSDAYYIYWENKLRSATARAEHYKA